MSESPIRPEWIGSWDEVWRRDDPYRFDGEAYLDQATADISWIDRDEAVLCTPDERAAILSQVGQDPSRYVRVPPLTHGEHHAVFARFLATLHRPETGLCNSASIGGFLKDVDRHFGETEALEIRESWYSYHEDALRERATDWFRNLGLTVVWEATS